MTTIGPSAAFSGELTSDDDVRIEGQFDGHILLRNGTVTVAASGHVTADIRATRVVVQGTVRGFITASERIELAPGADVHGSLSANQVVIADGARFNGHVDMGRRTVAALVAHYKAGKFPVT